MRIVVVIPTYNEAGAIGGVLAELTSVFNSDRRRDWHALVVDGNSTDETREIVRAWAQTNPNIHLVVEPKKRGLAMAYVFGITHAIQELQTDAFVEFDGDGQHDPAYLMPMADALESGADYVIGSRYVEGGMVPLEWKPFNKFLSRFGSLYSRLLLELPVHDATSGFKMTRVRNFADKISLDESRLMTKHYAYKIQLLSEMERAGARIQEVPITFRHREKGVSKSTWRDITESLRVTALLRLQNLRDWRLLRVLAVGGTGFLIQAAVFELLGIQSGLLTPSTATLIGAEAAVLSNFFLNNRFSFADRKNNSSLLSRLTRFHLVSSGSVLMQWILVFTLEHMTGNALILRTGFVLGVGLGFLINYAGYYFWVWKKR